jgi:hypothetical protein
LELLAFFYSGHFSEDCFEGEGLHLSEDFLHPAIVLNGPGQELILRLGERAAESFTPDFTGP